MKCKTCQHYSLYKMITGKRTYRYNATILCETCRYFSMEQDNYKPIEPKKVANDP